MKINNLFPAPKNKLFNNYYPIYNTNQYSVHISGGNHKSNRYVEMKHGQQYSVVMTNNTLTRCQASLTIDGHHIRDFLINGHTTINIDRPVHSHKRFTFYRTDTGFPSSFQTGIIPGNHNNGVVEVSFTPEKGKIDVYKYHRTAMNSSSIFEDSCMESNSSYSEGGTALSGHSHQHFDYVNPLNLDYNRQITLSYRLVAKNYDLYMDIEPISIRQRPPPPVSRPNIGFIEDEIYNIDRPSPVYESMF